MIEADFSGMKRLEKFLGEVNKKGVYFAERDTRNDMAFDARQRTVERLQKGFILRNQYTQKSIRVNKAKKLLDPAVVGSTADYMEDQEFGDIVRARRGSASKPIPTAVASGEPKGTRRRRKVVRKPNRVSEISLKRSSRGNATNARRVHEAKRYKEKFVYLDLGKTKGIFQVKGTKKNPKVLLVQDLSKRAVRVSARPTLKPSTIEAAKRGQQFYNRRLQSQVDRHKGLMKKA